MPPLQPPGRKTTSGSAAAVLKEHQEEDEMEKMDPPTEMKRSKSKLGNVWELRRRRLAKNNKVDDSSNGGSGSAKDLGASLKRGTNTKRRNNKPRKVDGDDGGDEIDPYESDPGESYRDHCMQLRGVGSKTCLTMPTFLRTGAGSRGPGDVNGIPSASSIPISIKENTVERESVATAPPSPMASEMGDLFGQVPASLPSNLGRVRYSLRSSITDGSEKQPQGPSVMERRDLRPNSVHVNVSHWSDTGGRPYMEDRYAVENLDAVQVEVSPVAVRSNTQDVEVTYGPKRTRRVTMPLTYLGVFDGHGGEKASQFCADWMSAYIRNDASYPYDLGYSMKNAFTTIDEDFVSTGNPDGSTACCVTMVGGRRIVCANAGDSRAIVVRRDGSIVRLSRDHKPGIPDETRRISDLGGRVIYWGRWRVEGLLAVSRSIGDASLKPYITSEPEICEYDVGKDDLFLMLSSDGVWDVMDNEEAAHVVIASSCAMEDGKLMIDTDRFKWAARNLCDHARSCGSTDNFSIIVVDLKSCGNPRANDGRYVP